jgi:hypothetical protein
MTCIHVVSDDEFLVLMSRDYVILSDAIHSDVRERVSTRNGERSVLLSESIGMRLFHKSRRRYGKQSDDASNSDTKKVQ